jgi:hypothetical protein
MFPIKNGLKQRYVLTPMLLNFAVEYTIKRFQVNWVGSKLNGTHQFLVYADGLGGSIHTIQKSTEGNADKTKYMVMSRDQNAGQSYIIETDSISFERVGVIIFGNNLNKSKFYSGRN